MMGDGFVIAEGFFFVEARSAYIKPLVSKTLSSLDGLAVLRSFCKKEVTVTVSLVLDKNLQTGH